MDEKWNPGLLLQTSGAYWKSCTLHGGVKLDLFTLIGDRKLAVEEITKEKGFDQRGLSNLLDALCAMKLLDKDGDRYFNTEESLTFLSKDSEKNVAHMIMHHHHLAESWTKIHQAVESGGPVRSRASFSSSEVRESFLMGMFNTAMGVAPFVVPYTDLSGCKTLLDLGGGPGTYAIHFCKENPDLKATVFDLPTTKPFAEKTIERFSLKDRINFTAGDFNEDSIEGSFDAVWLSHILHGEGPENAENIIKKAADCLNPGGQIIIHEFILDNDKKSPEFPALFSINMLLGTENGRSYSEDELRDMLKNSGIKDIERIRMDVPNDSGLMIGKL